MVSDFFGGAESDAGWVRDPVATGFWWAAMPDKTLDVAHVEVPGSASWWTASFTSGTVMEAHECPDGVRWHRAEMPGGAR